MPEVRLIDANALMEKVCVNCQQNDCVPDATDTVYGCMFAESIYQMPTIEAEPVRHGRWELTDNFNFKRCSECGKKMDRLIADYTHYCANCGARMDGKQEEENEYEQVDS